MYLPIAISNHLNFFLIEPQTKMSVHIEEVPKDLEEQVEELHAQVVILICGYICTLNVALVLVLNFCCSTSYLFTSQMNNESREKSLENLIE